MNEVKQLYIESVSQFVGKNISKNLANEIYKVIKGNAQNIEQIKRISVDNNQDKSHYFFADKIGSVELIDIYQNKKDSTIIIKKLTRQQVLTVGNKVSNAYGTLMTILKVDITKPDCINQRVTYKNSKGATFEGEKWGLLGLNR